MNSDLIETIESNDDCNELFDENYENLIKNVINFSINVFDQQISHSFPRLMDSNGHPLVLQPSLFPMVWPTIYFALEDESMSSVPNQLKPYLKWKLSSITANTMKTIVLKSGFRLLKDKNKKVYKNWSAIWCKHMKCNEFKAIKEYQKVNHFPGSFHFGRKDKLWQNLRSKAAKHGFDVFGSFHPTTFILPHDLHLLKKYWTNSEEQLFIVKPPASARGQGIQIINKFSKLPKTCRTKLKQYVKPSLIVQKYITNPCLLYNKTKFDLRVYVLITSVVPLRVYLYDDGLVRFASHKYSNDVRDIDNQFMHLTNYSVNKNHLNYVPNNDINGQTGNKWTLKTLWRYLSHSSKAVDVDQICNSIEDMIIKTIISCESHVYKLIEQNVKNRYSCFELLGFDIMLDSHYKPWLLEVNISPSLRWDSPVDCAVKSQLIKDMLNIIGYRIPPNFKKFEYFSDFICFNRRYYSHILTAEEELKHQKYESSFIDNEFSETHELLSHLTDYDIRQLVESEDEFSRVGTFKRIFPSLKSRDYLKYFDRLFYSNILLDEWEQHFADNRQKGIERLRSLILSRKHIFINDSNLINAFLRYFDQSLEENLLIEK